MNWRNHCVSVWYDIFPDDGFHGMQCFLACYDDFTLEIRMAISQLLSIPVPRKVAACIILSLLSVTSASLVLAHPAVSDPHNNPYHQMRRQRQLEQQTMNSRLLWKEELRQELESEIDTEKAIQDYYNQLN